jgi:hypothetical protein
VVSLQILAVFVFQAERKQYSYTGTLFKRLCGKSLDQQCEMIPTMSIFFHFYFYLIVFDVVLITPSTFIWR